MTTWTAANYLQDAARTVAEMKTAMEQNLAATKEMIGGLPVQQLTISSSSITPAAGTTALIAIATPGGASTANLNTIVPTNIKDGAWLALRMANAGQVPTVKHAAGGSGQFSLAGAADFALADPSVVLIVALSGTTWVEVGRFYGNQVNAYHLFYQVAGLGANRFTGRQDFNKGANLTAAATLTLGADGNYFTVNGNTNITGFATGNAGTEVTLLFTGTPTLVHSAAFDLGGADITARNGTVLRFACDGGTTWRLTSSPGGSAVITRDVNGISIIATAAETNLYGVVIPAGMLAPTGHVRVSMQGFVGVDQAGFPTGTPGVKLLQFITYISGIAFTTSWIVTAAWDGATVVALNPWTAVTYDVHIVYHGGSQLSAYSVTTCPVTYAFPVPGTPVVVGGGWPIGNPGFGNLTGFNPALAIPVQINGKLANYVGGADQFYKMHGMLLRE